MTTITYNETPVAQRNAWDIPDGHQRFGVPRAEFVFSHQFTILALGAGDDWVLNLSFIPPANYFYKVVDLNFVLGATSETDIQDVDGTAWAQFQNYRNDGSQAQFFTFLMPNTSSIFNQDSADHAIKGLSVTSANDFWATFKPDILQLPGIILSRVGGQGAVTMQLHDGVASSDGAWEGYGYCRMLQYDVSDEFEYLLHTPQPSVPA